MAAWFLHPELKFYHADIDAAATGAGLDPSLVAAVCLTESSGYTAAYRYEPLFWARYHLAENPAYTGRNPRRWSASYGLMQILATTAKEAGHVGLPEALFQPEIGLRYGCGHLAKCLAWASQFKASDRDTLIAALAAYNGGRSSAQKPPNPRNIAYSLRVLKHLEKMA